MTPPRNRGRRAQTVKAEVIVTASKAPAAKRASVGGFADAPLLQTPAAVTVITQKELQDLQIRHTSDAMKFDASVNDAYNAVGYAEHSRSVALTLDTIPATARMASRFPATRPYLWKTKNASRY